MTATYCDHGYLVEGSRHECHQCTEPVRQARRWLAQQDPVKLASDARALADVRTLDDWAETERARAWECKKLYLALQDARAWRCMLITDDDHRLIPLYGATPDEARSAAAKWVREQKRG